MITKKEEEIIQGIAMVLAAENPTYITSFDDVVEELEEKYRISTDAGAYRLAFILDNVVVKMSKDKSRNRKLVAEAKFIQKMREDEKYGRHFPETELFKVGDVTLQIQEKVNMSHDSVSYDDMDEVIKLGIELGIEDIHSNNYGWKIGPNGLYPVFVDVDFRHKTAPPRRNRRRSWFVR